MTQLATAGDIQHMIQSTAIRAGLVGGMLRGLTSFLSGAPFKDCIQDPLFLTARPLRALGGIGIVASHKLVRATPGRILR